MFKLATIAVLLGSFSLSLVAQIEVDVYNELQHKDFKKFEAFTLKVHQKNKLRRCYWENIRQVTPSYSEGAFIFEESFPSVNNPNHVTVKTFRVILITSNTEIIFYELSKKIHGVTKGYWDADYEILHSYKNEENYKKFKEEFKSLFLADINEDELFNYEFIYGRSCDISGLPPRGRILIDELIENKNKPEIIKWLQSTTTEKQIYALEALYQLKNCGVSLTPDEYKMVQFVIKKTGSMSVCSGCSYTIAAINDITSDYNFDY